MARVQAELKAHRLDGLLAFQPETVTWLTGFFTRGYGSFQLAIIPAEGQPVLVCRDVEEYYLDATCVFPGRAMWTDSDAPVAVAARAIRACLGATAKAGVETAGLALSVARYEQLKEGLRVSNSLMKAGLSARCA